jgi:hypothetical protein
VGLACFAACVVWCLARPNSMQRWYIGGPVTSVVSLVGQFLDIRLARRNAAAAGRDPDQDDPAPLRARNLPTRKPAQPKTQGRCTRPDRGARNCATSHDDAHGAHPGTGGST